MAKVAKRFPLLACSVIHADGNPQVIGAKEWGDMCQYIRKLVSEEPTAQVCEISQLEPLYENDWRSPVKWPRTGGKVWATAFLMILDNYDHLPPLIRVSVGDEERLMALPPPRLMALAPPDDCLPPKLDIDLTGVPKACRWVTNRGTVENDIDLKTAVVWPNVPCVVLVKGDKVIDVHWGDQRLNRERTFVAALIYAMTGGREGWKDVNNEDPEHERMWNIRVSNKLVKKHPTLVSSLDGRQFKVGGYYATIHATSKGKRHLVSFTL